MVKKIACSVLLSIVVLVGAAQAQTSLLPTLQQVRAEFPADWSHEQRGEYLNKVAWVHRAEGWGLLHKPGGNRCPTPQGVDVSCDYLVYRPTLQGFDVLADETTPAWSLGDSFISQPERWIPPVVPTVGPVVPNPGTPDELLQRVITIEEVVAQMRQMLLEHETAQAEERAKAEAFRQAVGTEYAKFGKFVAKYIAPAVGAWLLGNGL